MSRNDFCRCTPEQFRRVYELYRKNCEVEYRLGWERTRAICMSVLQPYLKKGIQAHELMKFSWDEEGDEEVLSKEEQEERYKAALERYGISDINSKKGEQ